MNEEVGMRLQSTARRITILSLVALALHYLWEQMHLPLYTGYEHLTEMPIIHYAVAGDVMYTLLAVALWSAARKRLDWIALPSSRDIAWLAALGFLIALYVEYKAFLFDRWVYTDAMPLIPILEVGLSPVLQMTVLLPLSVFLASEVDRAVRRVLQRFVW